MPQLKVPSDDQKPTVAIAGAGGCIGRWLIKEYRHKFNFVALSRQKIDQNPYPEVEWRQAELYSITYTVEALKGEDVAIYLVVNGKVGQNGELGFYLLLGQKPMLQLTMIPDRSEFERQLFYISGGWLVKRFDYGWLEFREVLDSRYIISAIHEFVPSLPWFVYVNTQAKLHLWVMNRFKKYLEKKAY